jgi:hypothetical protein
MAVMSLPRTACGLATLVRGLLPAVPDLPISAANALSQLRELGPLMPTLPECIRVCCALFSGSNPSRSVHGDRRFCVDASNRQMRRERRARVMNQSGAFTVIVSDG